MSEAKIIKIMFNLKKEILNVIISQKNGEKETKVMKRVPSIAFFILILAIQLFPFSQKVPPKKLTVEWLFDEEIQEKFRPPRYTWLDDGSVLLLDYQKAKGIRTLELFDPRMPGERTAAIDRGRVLKAFEKMVGEEAPEEIEWPEAVDPKGQALVYILDDDLYCVQISDSAVKRLTRTEAEETSVTFSPDGKWISFIRDNDIYALDWREESLIRLTSGATETLLNGTLSWVYWEEIYDRTSLPYTWSPDSEAIAYLQTDDSSVSVSTFVNFEPATQEAIRQRYPKAGQVNPKVRLGIVELVSAKTTWMDCGMYEYLARFNWLPESKEIAVQTMNRRQSELRLLIASRRSGRSREILKEKQAAWINLNNSLRFLKDGQRFIWLSERDGYQHLYLYRRDGRLLRQLTQGDFMVFSVVGVDGLKNLVYFSSNKKSLKERHLFRVNLDGSELERITRQDGIHAVQISPSREYFLDSYSSSSEPPSLSLYNAGGEPILTVSSSAKDILLDYPISFPEFHTFKTDDGLLLPVMMTRPVSFNPQKKYPAIIYVYGGPDAPTVVDRWGRRTLWNSLLCQEGFFVFTFEVRAGMMKNKALAISVYRQAYGMQNVKDILSGIRWIRSFPYIDAERLGIWGWSGGGCTTLYTMTHCDAFKAGIAVAPVSDWHFYDTIYTERYQDTPQNNPEGYEETSSVLAASNLKGRLLIVHGTYDDNVHPQNTYAFVDELIEHHIPFEMMIYPWRKHGIRDNPAQIHLYNLMLDFWRRSLK